MKITAKFCEKLAAIMRVINVAEKNDAAKSLAGIMSNGTHRKREGFSKYNKIYEFNYNIFNQNCSMLMTSVSGHLMNYDFPPPHNKWSSCSPVQLFDLPIQKMVQPNFSDIKRTLEQEARHCQVLIVWTDGDREGENIGFEVIDVCFSSNPRLKVYRARFSEITQRSVQRACNNLGEPNRNVSEAVDVRQELDLRIGAAFTRLQTLRLQKVYPTELGDQLISFGSCQFPTLGFVVERYKQIEAFIAEQFWKIRVVHTTEEGSVEFMWKRHRLFDHTCCQALYQQCLESPSATVVNCHTKNKSKWRPQPLDTVEMEKMASKKLGMNAKQAMKVAESLYTKGFISYPRTETNMFPKGLDLAPLVREQTVDPNWGGFAARVAEHGPNPRQGSKTDNAHPPITPTKYTDGLQGDQQRLYEFIVRHFLACCSQDAQGVETKVLVDIAGEEFTATGLVILERNYLEVYPYERWSDKTMPNYRQGQVFQPSLLEVASGETSPPALLSEADLIGLMDKHGIGTDATHAEHIDTIQQRNYVGLNENRRFLPGQLGMGLVEGYNTMGYKLAEPHLRADLEADLKRICEGQKRRDDVLREQIAKYKQVFIDAAAKANMLDLALAKFFGEGQEFQEAAVPSLAKTLRPCPQCSQPMIIKEKREGGLMVSCTGYPQCKAAVWLPAQVLSASVEDTLCSRCGPGDVHQIKFKFKRGSVPPYIPEEYVSCIGACDTALVEALNLRLNYLQRNQQQQQQQQQPVNRQNQVNVGRNAHRNLDSGIDDGIGATGTLRPSNFNNSSSSFENRTQNNFANRSSFSGHGTAVESGYNSDRNRNPSQSSRAAASNDVENDVMCNCNEAALLLTVRKAGANQGRQFYKCPKAVCSFFLWSERGGGEEEARRDEGQRSAGVQPLNNQQQQQQQEHRTNAWGEIMCRCGQAAKSLTVRKEGPNKGRQFYACPKPQNQGCGFFQWDDSENNNKFGDNSTTTFPTTAIANNNSGFGNTGQGGGNSNSFKKKRRPVTCGICKQQGHTKKTCPNK